jgi:hypothetical protein
LRAKGRERRVLIVGIMERPFGTARLPCWMARQKSKSDRVELRTEVQEDRNLLGDLL